MSFSTQLPITGVGITVLGITLGRSAMVVGAVVMILVCLVAIGLSGREPQVESYRDVPEQQWPTYEPGWAAPQHRWHTDRP